MDRVVEALRLRTWALQVLSTGWQTPPDVPIDAWKLFLKAERCAVALSTRAEGDAPPILHAVATIELQRILSARAQIEHLGRLSAQAGERIIVLKGGLMALSATVAVDVVDVDVLAEPCAAPRIAALLDREGYVGNGGGADAHLPQRRQPNAVHVEVHHSLAECSAAEMWAQAEPVGRPGLWKAAALDQVWHALRHTAYTHPFRRGALRDLILIGWADAGCDQGAREMLQERMGSDSVLSNLLRMARDLRDDRAPIDAFRKEAAAHYLLSPRPARFGEFGLRPPVVRSVYSMLDGPEARSAYWNSVWHGRSQLSPWRALAMVERVWPLGGRVARRLARLARVPLVEILALPIALRAAKLARAYPRIEPRTLDIRSGEP
jgi:Uncharacterised nucleotidyltransferase